MKTKYNKLELLIEKADEIILLMSKVFDTHQFIRILARENQKIYIEALCESISKMPFKDIHSKIGKKLKENSNIKELQTNFSSKDIFGTKNNCSLWERL